MAFHFYQYRNCLLMVIFQNRKKEKIQNYKKELQYHIMHLIALCLKSFFKIYFVKKKSKLLTKKKPENTFAACVALYKSPEIRHWNDSFNICMSYAINSEMSGKRRNDRIKYWQIWQIGHQTETIDTLWIERVSPWYYNVMTWCESMRR